MPWVGLRIAPSSTRYPSIQDYPIILNCSSYTLRIHPPTPHTYVSRHGNDCILINYCLIITVKYNVWTIQPSYAAYYVI